MHHLTTFLAILLAPLLSAQTLTRGPSVWESAASSVLVAFKSSSSAVGSVEWGPTAALGQLTTGPSTATHAIRLTGLLPDHFYWYRVRLGSTAVTPTYRTRTSPVDDSDVTFFVFGDSGNGSSNQLRVAGIVQAWSNWDLGIMPGDIVYPDGQASGHDPYFFTPYGPTLRSTPFYPTLGNHDYHTSSGQPYLDAFYLPTTASGSERWYSFDHGKIHFIGLDSNTTTSTQTTWLRNDLIAARAAGVSWIFVTFHHAAYTSGTHGRNQWVYQTWCPIFEEFEVDVVFQGHDHIYERTTVRRDWFPNKRGVVYFVAGTGGTSVYAISPQSYTAFAMSRYGAMKVDVRGQVFRSVFLDGGSSSLGQQHDHYVMARGPATPALRTTTRDPGVGQTLLAAVDAPAGANYSVWFSGTSGYTPVPGIGLVHLGTLDAILATGIMGTSQSAAFPLSVPNQAALVDVEFFLQGVTVSGPTATIQLTDLLTGRVR